MVTYAILQPKYSVNASSLFVTGESSGAMMSSVLAATYPELVAAASLYSGVTAGCFVCAGVDQWNNACASGQSTVTPEKWGETARAMDSEYIGPRQKMQIWHGSAEKTINPKDYQKDLKQWMNVFGVSTTPTATKADYPEKNYALSAYGSNVEGIYATGVGYLGPAHLAASEAWFELP